MSNLSNRTRVVYVRLSDAEFQSLRDLCHKHGAKNMSDLVRSAMKKLETVHESGFESEVTGRLAKLETSLDLLTKTMERISAGEAARL